MDLVLAGKVDTIIDTLDPERCQCVKCGKWVDVSDCKESGLCAGYCSECYSVVAELMANLPKNSHSTNYNKYNNKNKTLENIINFNKKIIKLDYIKKFSYYIIKEELNRNSNTPKYRSYA